MSPAGTDLCTRPRCQRRCHLPARGCYHSLRDGETLTSPGPLAPPPAGSAAREQLRRRAVAPVSEPALLGPVTVQRTAPSAAGQGRGVSEEGGDGLGGRPWGPKRCRGLRSRGPQPGFARLSRAARPPASPRLFWELGGLPSSPGDSSWHRNVPRLLGEAGPFSPRPPLLEESRCDLPEAQLKIPALSAGTEGCQPRLSGREPGGASSDPQPHRPRGALGYSPPLRRPSHCHPGVWWGPAAGAWAGGNEAEGADGRTLLPGLATRDPAVPSGLGLSSRRWRSLCPLPHHPPHT